MLENTIDLLFWGLKFTIWDGCSQQDSDNLEKLPIEAGRIVTGLPLFASRQSIYSETSRVVEGKKDFLVISNRQLGKT
jgi:hypothetical protein